MKSTTFIAVLLVLLSLLLVVGAAALFLFQGRRNFIDETGRLENEIQSRELSLTQLQTTVDAQGAALQTQEASLSQSLLQLATREAELAEAQLAVQAATQDAAQAATQQATQETPEATATPEPQLQDEDVPPPLEIVYPQFGIPVSVDTVLPVIVIGYAREGIAQMTLEVGGRAPVEESFSDATTYHVLQHSFSNLELGRLTITATLTTSNDEMELSTVDIFVNDVQPQQDEDGTQGLISAPVAILRP